MKISKGYTQRQCDKIIRRLTGTIKAYKDDKDEDKEWDVGYILTQILHEMELLKKHNKQEPR